MTRRSVARFFNNNADRIVWAVLLLISALALLVPLGDGGTSPDPGWGDNCRNATRNYGC